MTLREIIKYIADNCETDESIKTYIIEELLKNIKQHTK